MQKCKYVNGYLENDNYWKNGVWAFFLSWWNAKGALVLVVCQNACVITLGPDAGVNKHNCCHGNEASIWSTSHRLSINIVNNSLPLLQRAQLSRLLAFIDFLPTMPAALPFNIKGDVTYLMKWSILTYIIQCRAVLRRLITTSPVPQPFLYHELMVEVHPCWDKKAELLWTTSFTLTPDGIS